MAAASDFAPGALRRGDLGQPARAFADWLVRAAHGHPVEGACLAVAGQVHGDTMPTTDLALPNQVRRLRRPAHAGVAQRPQ